MVRYKQRRRGIVLLVVLSLLVLFTVLVVTYLVVAGQYQRTAEVFAERELRESLTDTAAQTHLDRALFQLVRDTTERRSAVRFHSLLRDYYGEAGFTGTLLGSFPSPHPADWTVERWNTMPAFMPDGGQAYTLSDEQFLDLIVDQTSLAGTDGQAFALSSQPGFYAGSVLTITSGRAVGWSTTIVGFFYAGNTPILRVLNLPYPDISLDWDSVTDVSFVVNGRPFNGSGVGLRIVADNGVQVAKLNDTGTVTVTGAPVELPVALLPHSVYWEDAANLYMRRGGSNEPYDAVDYHNMFLGLVHPEATNSRDIIPSFHRPALINYWMNNYAALWTNDDFKRLVSLRPVEPNFTGGNPSFTYVNGPWDVDNDGDGVPDSVWIDLGMPVQTDPGGRMYKPLFAILCVDLDGRLNVNAHGNPTAFYANRPAAIDLVAGNTANFPKGLGYGPAEIALTAVASQPSALMSARYGTNVSPGRSGLDLVGMVKFFEEPKNYFLRLNQTNYEYTSYSTPADLRGELAFGLDPFGRLVYERIPDAVTDARANSPYELNLLEPSVHDRQFTAADLEAVLRQYDVDAIQLPNRLRELLNLTNVENARLVTTHSFDPPVPGTALFSDVADQYRDRGWSIQELLSLRLLAETNPPTENAIPNLLKHLMPSELLLGQRLDLNRPLGNARDDTLAGNAGHAVVDEIGEQAGEIIWREVGTNPERTEFQNVPVYHSNGADVNSDGQYDLADHLLARQLLARHIYVLLMALRDESFLLTDDSGTPSEVATAYALAQYAINIVDFRDADSIMTPFEFDIYPFRRANATAQTTWKVDGNLMTDEGTHRGVVWGCERPELLITETLAWHARRTEDTDNDDGMGTLTTDGDNPDPDFDQRLMPRGSFFVELFNPSTSDTDVRPAEFSDVDGSGVPLNNGVQLNKTVTVTASGVTVTSPVWRMMFVKDRSPGTPRDPDHWNPIQRPDPNPVTGEDESRLIYFVNPIVVGATIPPTSGVQGVYATSLPVNTATPEQYYLQPGQYAVVGSPGIQEAVGSGINYISPVGRSASWVDETTLEQLDMANTRRVVLAPAGAEQVRILSNGAGLVAAVPADPNNPAVPGTIINYPNPGGTNAPYLAAQPAQANILATRAFVIDTPLPLSVSEPLEGYVTTGFQNPVDSSTVEGRYATPHDKPLDLDRYGGQLMTDGTSVWGTIHLQRLANPTRPYHDTLNPYRTIDSLRVDLTSFNGLNAPGTELVSAAPITRNSIRLFAVQRGDVHSLPGTVPDMRRQFWSQEPPVAPSQTADWGVDLGNTHYLNFHLRTTLGALNHGFWPFNGQVAGGYRGSPSVKLNDAPTVNDHAFSSLAWNNRPFVSGYELMQVPALRSSQLLRWYSLPSTNSPYDTDNPTAQYGHLVNFYHSSRFNQINASIHVYRLLEYVHVPSRFVGTDLLLNPKFDTANPAQPPYFSRHLLPDPPYPANTRNQIANPSTLNPAFLTPFNRVSMYRDPGRVNINTIYHEKVWEALFGGGYAQVPFGNVIASRRGSAGASTELLPRNPLTGLPDPRFPSFFANPFRPPGHGSLVPLPDLERQDIETTLLRSRAVVPDYGDPAQSPPGNLPLMEGGHVSMNETTIASTHPRNSFFRYNALRRLGNMITTRSNVYAIWITVGYFEVEANPSGVDKFHSDGYRVAQELGIDEGQRRRHKAFYIVDRTVPVAFQPGQDHNVDRAVLLRRFVE